jgi:hypothetical protein
VQTATGNLTCFECDPSVSMTPLKGTVLPTSAASAWQGASVSTPSDRALLTRASRVATLSFWTMLACGVVMLFGYVATLPPIVWILVSVVLALSIPAWAVAVFRDARSSGHSVGSAIWKSVRLTWNAMWELLP